MKTTPPQKGAAVVEFAVLFLLLLVLVFGIIEFGFVWLQSHYVANAAREGARVASNMEPLDNNKIQEAVVNYLDGLYSYLPGGDTVNCCDEPTGDAFIVIYVESDNLSFFADVGSGPDPEAVKVSVTVKTEQVWKPILWDLLPLITGGKSNSLNQVTEHAVFVKLQ